MAIILQAKDLKRAVQEGYERLFAKYAKELSDTEKMLYIEGFTDGIFLIGRVVGGGE